MPVVFCARRASDLTRRLDLRMRPAPTVQQLSLEGYRAQVIADELARLYRNPAHITCAHCGRPFLRRPSYIRQYRRHFCSRDCETATDHADHADRLRARLVANIVVGPGRNPCLLWQGKKTWGGYGSISHCGPDRKVENCSGARLVHRLSWELFVGPIPDGMQIDHLCRVRNCVNILHLEPVTPEVHYERSYLFQFNKNQTHCKRGHPFDETNTLLQPTTHGRQRLQRRCRVCRVASRIRERRSPR
jgi:hypothetical protein